MQATTDADGQFALSLGSSGLPTRFALGQNYPNPFNPSTVIPYQLSTTAHVRLDVFNVLGQRVATLVDGEQAAGAHTVVWMATDEAGQAVSAGVYIYRLVAGDATATGRMVLVDGQAGAAAAAPELADVVDALAAPVVESLAEVPVYGLAVWGDGLATYVDTAFVVGSGSVEVVLEASAGPRGKASASVGSPPEVLWFFKDIEFSNQSEVGDEVSQKLIDNCPGVNASTQFAFEDKGDFLVYEMELPMYDCYSGVQADALAALGEGSITLLQDVILGLTGIAIIALGTTFAPVLAFALTIYSAAGDVHYLAAHGSTVLELSAPVSTRVGFIGKFGDSTAEGEMRMDGEMRTGTEYIPVLMVRVKTQPTASINLTLRNQFTYEETGSFLCRNLGQCSEFRAYFSAKGNLGSFQARAGHGYFLIPKKTVTLEVLDDPSDDLALRTVHFTVAPPSFLDKLATFERELTVKVKEGNFHSSYVPRFTARWVAGTVLFLDASSSIVPQQGAVLRYDWILKTATGESSIGTGPTMQLNRLNFDEWAGAHESVEIELVVKVTKKGKESELRVSQEVKVPVGLTLPTDPIVGDTTGEMRTFSLPGGGEMEFVWIEGGKTFMMGSPNSEEGRYSDEGPVHEVEISRGFWLGKHEVTRGSVCGLCGGNEV